MGLWDDFINFAFRGNAVDMAVGIIIGNSFVAIVNSLINDIFMPIIGLVLGAAFGRSDYNTWTLKISDASITWGKFIEKCIYFIAIAALLFVIISFIIDPLVGKPVTPAQTAQQVAQQANEDATLIQIRDILTNIYQATH